MRLLIKEKDSKKIFNLLKEGYEITMQTLEDFNNKTNYVIFAYKKDKNGNYIYEEQEKQGE